MKLEYKDYIILFKSGNFYISFDEDAVILNELFNFKINELKNNIKVGFPISSLINKINTLKELKISYLVVENKEIINEYSFDDNNYYNYSKSVFSVISINSKINNICDRIKLIKNPKIKKEIISKIENILKSYQD